MFAARSLLCSSAVIGCLLLSAPLAKGDTATPTTKWFAKDHTGSPPRNITITQTATSFINTDKLAQKFLKPPGGFTWFPAVNLTVTLHVVGGTYDRTFTATTDGAGVAGWTATGLPLDVSTFTCTVSYAGGDTSGGVVLLPADSTFLVKRVGRP